MHTAMLFQMNIYQNQGGGQYSFSSMFKFTTFGKEQCHSTIKRVLVFKCEKYLGTLWDVKCYYGNQIVRY